MKKIKTVTVRYTSKKTGKTKVYTYTYGAQKYKAKQNILVTKKGKANKKAIEKVYNSIKDSADREDFKRFVTWYTNPKNKIDKALTERSIRSRLAKDKREKMIINAGYELEDVLNELGMSEEEYFSDSSWNGDKIVNSRGE